MDRNLEIRLEYWTTPQKHLDGRVLRYLRGKGLGGSSFANYLGYIRGSASDYNAWAEMVGDESWKWENVVERYKEIENLHFDDDQDQDGFVKLKEGVHGFAGPVDITLPSRRHWPPGVDVMMKAALNHGWPLNPDQNSGDLVGMGTCSTTTHDGYRTTSASAYLSGPPSNLVIWTNSTVTKVLFDEASALSKPKAIGVLLADGRKVQVTSEVILSLGTIDTPKLLMLSGIGPRAELEALDLPCLVHNPRVGKDLIDHLYCVLQWGSTDKLGKKVAFQKNVELVAAARAQWMLDRTGPNATLNTINLIGFLKFDPQRSKFDEFDRLDPEIKAWLKQDNVPQFELFLQGFIPDSWDAKNGECLGMGIMLMNPQSRGSVTLASNNPAAMPLIDVNFLSQPYDREAIVNAVREAMVFVTSELAPHIVSKVQAPESESDEDILKFCKEGIMSVLHPVGTVKMGREDDPTACTDSDFRVRGVDGLRVVDLSVCPVITK